MSTTTVVVLLLGALVLCLALVAAGLGRHAVIGGWAVRGMHRCGEVHQCDYGFPDVCPRCGDNTSPKDWARRVGRPTAILPWGWEWREDYTDVTKR